MKCANCGAELKVGSIYCYVCGKEAQIVSDYNLLEDDFLRDVLKEKEKKIAEQTPEEIIKRQDKAAKAGSEQPGKKSSKAGGEQSGKKVSKALGDQPAKKAKGNRRIKKRVVFAVASMILLIILITAIVLLVNHGRENSYDYQMQQAREYQRQRNYREAERHVLRALELNSDSLEAQLFLADIYVLRGEDKKAVAFLEKLLKEHKDSLEIYQKLIDLYEEQGDSELICGLIEATDDEEVLELLSSYIPDMPKFDLEEGVYTEPISVEILKEGDCSIYYTVNGSDPRQGIEYQGPIAVRPGDKMLIRAVTCSPYGVFSQEIEGVFQVELEKPEVPNVNPDGGNFYAPQSIHVVVPEGCKVYYTWDGTEPNMSSEQYLQPMAIPEGNNILSLVLVDQYGMRSDVLRCNYIYLP